MCQEVNQNSHISSLIFKNTYKIDTIIIITILQMRKLKDKNIN